MSKQAEKYKGRGLHNTKFLDSFKTKKLKGLLDIVKDKKNDLVLQIRNNYVNIYYKGGNLVKIKFKYNKAEDEVVISFDFDKGYFFQEEAPQKKKEDLLGIINQENPDFQYFVGEMKERMDEFWYELEHRPDNPRTLAEKNEQHKLCVNNTENDVYTVIDLEFQVSSKSKYKYEKLEKQRIEINKHKLSPRFDIIAVRNSDKQLCVIELKSGTGALGGESGLGDHADSFEGTIKRNHESFVEEIKNIIQDKKDLGLLNKSFSINDKAPEFMFAFVPKKDDKDRDDVVRNEKEQIQFMKDEIVRQKCSDYNVLFLKDDGNFRLE